MKYSSYCIIYGKPIVASYVENNTCARCGKPFEKTTCGHKAHAIEFGDVRLWICPSCIPKYYIDFNIEVL